MPIYCDEKINYYPSVHITERMTRPDIINSIDEVGTASTLSSTTRIRGIKQARCCHIRMQTKESKTNFEI